MTAPYTPPPPDLPPPRSKKEERLLHRIEKAGVRASRRAGHLVTPEELLDTRIQIVPAAIRLLIGLLALASTWAAFAYGKAGDVDASFGFGFVAVVLLLFAIFGVRRTISEALDNVDPGTTMDLIGLSIDAIAAVLKAVHR